MNDVTQPDSNVSGSVASIGNAKDAFQLTNEIDMMLSRIKAVADLIGISEHTSDQLMSESLDSAASIIIAEANSVGKLISQLNGSNNTSSPVEAARSTPCANIKENCAETTELPDARLIESSLSAMYRSADGISGSAISLLRDLTEASGSRYTPMSDRDKEAVLRGIDVMGQSIDTEILRICEWLGLDEDTVNGYFRLYPEHRKDAAERTPGATS